MLTEYLYGLNMNKKINEYLERCKTELGQKEVKDEIFGETANPKYTYKTIWTRMKKHMKATQHGVLDTFQFFHDIAGKNAPLVLENFNFEIVNVQNLLNLVPYLPNGGLISLQEIAEYIVSKLSPLIVKPSTTSETAGLSTVAGPYTIAVRSTKEVFLPNFLNTTVGNLKASKTVFRFKNAPNLMASHFEVSFPANFQGVLVKDLETHGKFLQSPLDTFLLT